MTDDSPIASFLIPVYNAEAFLAESLESALAQSEKNIEIVAIDDGSTDSSPDILRRFAAQDPRVRVFEEPHRGMTPSFNRGLEVARGKYICRLDSDDLTAPDRVEKQVRFLEANPDHVLVGGQVILIGTAGEIIGNRAQLLSDDEIQAQIRQALPSPFVHSSVMFRRDAILSMGGYDPLFTPADDYDLWIRLSAKYRLANLPGVVCKYRVHENQVSTSAILRQLFAALCAFTALRGVPRETILQSVQAPPEDYFPALRRLGYRDDEIAEHLNTAYLYWAARLRSIGRCQMALQLLSEAAHLLRQSKSNSRYLAQVYRSEFLVNIDAHNYLRAARCLLMAAATSPAETTRRIFGKLLAPVSATRARAVS